MSLRPRLDRVTAGLAVGISAAVIAACTAGAYLYSVHHFKTLLETARDTALAEGEMVRVGLEHQMIEGDRSLVQRMIASFANEPRIKHLVLLDRLGRVRYSSGGLTDGDLTITSPTCQSCHQFPASRRESSRVIDTAGGTMLRTVVPFRNAERCHRCHDPKHTINGILILDTDAGEIRRTMNSELRWMVLGTGVLATMLVGAIALVIRILLLQRLRRFETTARLVAGGDLTQRVPSTGTDTISWLAREFNTMADSVTDLLAEVRTQRERLETIINSIDDGIAVLDAQRKVVAANDAFLRRTGWSREQLLGCACEHAARAICNDEECPTLRCLASGAGHVRIWERQAADGRTAWEEVHTSPIRGANGRVDYVVEVWRDISDRRSAEATLAESHRLASLGMLASGFSHELNTPLATVLTCVDGILRDARAGAADGPDLAHIGDSASIARDQVLRCRGITQRFLRMSRGQHASAEIVDLEEAIDAVVRLVEPTAREHQVGVHVTPVAPGLRARLPEADFQDALINVLVNAIQASRPGGQVEVSVEAGDPIHVRVTDAGPGIAPQDQSRIFEPFFSLSQGGTGLGLFVSLNHARRWGGDITVASTLGSGATFDLVVPTITTGARLEQAS